MIKLGGTPESIERRSALLAILARAQSLAPTEASYLAAVLRNSGSRHRTVSDERVFDDLVALHGKGLVIREGKPAKWSLPR